MTPQHHDMVPDQAADPFGERSAVLVRKPLHLLGARIVFDSNSRELLQLVDAAYAGLPRHRLSAKAPDLHVSLRLLSPGKRGEPPPLALLHGAALLGGATRVLELRNPVAPRALGARGRAGPDAAVSLSHPL